jgi:hypothetical protein
LLLLVSHELRFFMFGHDAPETGLDVSAQW